MEHTFKQASVHDYPSRVHINKPDINYSQETISTCVSYAHIWCSYLCTYTQLHKFYIYSLNRGPCVAISQQTMYNTLLCWFRVRQPF